MSTITRDMLLLNKAKNFAEMEPEQGYGDSISTGIKLYGSGSLQNLDSLRKWDD